MPKLRYLRTGLYLGEIRKNRFEPSQALAMALSPKTFASCVLLSSKDIRTVKYLKGETIDVADLKPAKEKGWQLVCVDGYKNRSKKGYQKGQDFRKRRNCQKSRI